jgi:uncharacterized protein
VLRTVVSLSLLVWAGARSAVAQVNSAGPSVPERVSEIATAGRGETRVAPDLAVFNVSVDSRATTAAAGVADNAAKLNAAMAAIRAAGVDSAQISTAGYSVNADYDKNRQIGFVVRNSLRVEVRRIADLGKVIDAALSSSSIQLNQLQFQRANTLDARHTALVLAVQEARRDAETMAQATGGSLGRLLSLSSSLSAPPIGRDPYNTAVFVTSASAQPTPILPGDLTVWAIASGRWEFIPRKAP